MKSFYFSKQCKTGHGQICLAYVWYTFAQCISNFFSIHYGYFNSIHIVNFRTIGGCTLIVLPFWDARNALRGKKETLVENIIEHLMGALGSYVVGAIIEKDCSVISTLLKAYMVNS